MCVINPLFQALISAVDQKIEFYIKETQQKSSIALILQCIQKDTNVPFSLKVIAKTDSVACIYISSASVLQCKGTFDCPMNQKLTDYIVKLVKGEPCGILTPNGEETSSITLRNSNSILVYGRQNREK